MNLTAKISKLEERLARQQRQDKIERTVKILRQNPTALFRILGLEADQWQVDFLDRQCSQDKEPHKRVVMACARQVGKSTILSLFLALRMMAYGESVAISAPSFRQSIETAQRIRRIIKQLGLVEIVRDSIQDTVLSNGGRLITLPSSGATARGFTLSWLCVDESAYLDENCDLLESMAPALSLANGGIVLCSSPGPCSGIMYDAWQASNWLKIQVRASECSRISADFLAEQRKLLGPDAFNREYEAQFVTGGTVLIDRETLAKCVREVDDDPDDDWMNFT